TGSPSGGIRPPPATRHHCPFFPALEKGSEGVNVLKPHLRTTVATLLNCEVSQHEIQRKTGVDRKTIRAIERAMAATNSPTPSTDPKANSPTPSPRPVGQRPPPRPPTPAPA